ncbi:MAG: N-acetyl-gamma-glutamyl-phosphate reductase [Opitutales bacterium]|nr:N-acetyl-gamma-glutamyl-phosphate reductase [Opitutales bacterium]
MQSKSVGIVGASGYSGELLVRLLSRHQGVESLVVASRSHAGKRLSEVLPSIGPSRFDESCFIESDPSALAASDTEVFFLALPHGVASEFALPLVKAGKTVIDLSADFRLFSAEVYREYYGEAHPAAEWLKKVPYLLPEWSGREALGASLIACPGCYPTSILLPLLPLIKGGLVDAGQVVINAVSGVSGAGKKASEFYSFCERTQSVLAYGLAKHRHLGEIEEQLTEAAGEPVVLQFTPHLVPMDRGIASTVVAPLKADLDAVYAAWNAQYGQCPFVRILAPGKAANTRNVVGSNCIEFSATADPRTGRVILTSVIDNLMKGASGQALQIFNLKFGFEETEGLL